MKQCEHCGSKDIVKAGGVKRVGKKIQRYQCNDCGKYLFAQKEIIGILEGVEE